MNATSYTIFISGSLLLLTYRYLKRLDGERSRVGPQITNIRNASRRMDTWTYRKLTHLETKM